MPSEYVIRSLSETLERRNIIFSAVHIALLTKTNAGKNKDNFNGLSAGSDQLDGVLMNQPALIFTLF